ncbi:MAG TPA: SIR2 family protein [Thermoleophilaceae bacterium]|nr:SIR2 family protein [Thermoleophilaceae bacterium]
MDMARMRPLPEHFAAAAALDPTQIDAITRLASQLRGLDVLPILGAGASYDCGMRLAGEIGEDLYNAYMADPSFAPHAANLPRDLGEVADAIWSQRDQKAVVKAVGLHDPALWPAADALHEHFCAYCVLARLARENIVKEAIGFNYDCGAEAGLRAQGFLDTSGTTHGSEWQDHATVIPDAATNSVLAHGGSFKLFKAHGCASRYRELAVTDEDRAADTIVIRKGQLANWRNDAWIRDVFRERSKNHVLLFIGFSGQDPVIYGEIGDMLQAVYSALQPDGTPRVVVLDYEPDTAALRSLVKAGLGEQPATNGTVTQVSTRTATTTAATLLLLAESLALRLDPALAQHNVGLPTAVDGRLAALTVSAPIMLRWSYLLRAPAANQFIQRINLEQAAEHGYVPLTADPHTTARALGARMELRRRLGETGPESTGHALEDHGFLVQGGCAYLPVGLGHDDLVAGCRPGSQIDQARRTLGHPRHLECVLVSDTDMTLRGVSIDTGSEVPLP